MNRKIFSSSTAKRVYELDLRVVSSVRDRDYFSRSNPPTEFQLKMCLVELILLWITLTKSENGFSRTNPLED